MITPLKVWQTGSGTQTNMNNDGNNCCSTIDGKLGSKPVHQNIQQNKSQSTMIFFYTIKHITWH